MNCSEDEYREAKKKLRIMSIYVMILTLTVCFISLFCFPPKIVPVILIIGFVGLTSLVVWLTDKTLEAVID